MAKRTDSIDNQLRAELDELGAGVCRALNADNSADKRFGALLELRRTGAIEDHLSRTGGSSCRVK